MEKKRKSPEIFRIGFITIFLALILIQSGYSIQKPGISGKVVTENGKPFPGVLVSLSKLKKGFVEYAPVEYPMIKTDGEGRFNFRNLEPGPYEIKHADGSVSTQDIQESISLEAGTYKVEVQPPRYGLSSTYYTVPYFKKFLTGEMQLPDREKETYYLSAGVEGIKYKGEPIALSDFSLNLGGDIMLIIKKEKVEKLKDKEIIGGSKVKGWWSLIDASGNVVVKFHLFGNLLVTHLILPGKYTLRVFQSQLFKDQEFKDVVVSPGKTALVKVPSQ